ncbi:hypothetical protein B0H13DRAFT_1850278 [Mycena leptocephala]|nr:hypothetical protein B0H13DRAFT_1850278 [Mycena leptocephala]
MLVAYVKTGSLSLSRMLRTSSTYVVPGTEFNGHPAYMYREAPFDLPCTDLSLRLAWWNVSESSSSVLFLARCRTSGQRRGNEHGQTLSATQLNQYWRYGFGTPEVQRHCQKVRLELPTPTDSQTNRPHRRRSPLQPTLKDYEAIEEGKDDTDIAPPPLVIRRGNLPVLEIETYIDLNAPKLAQCFAPDQGKPQDPVVQPAKKPAKDPKTKWATEDTELDAAD